MANLLARSSAANSESVSEAVGVLKSNFVVDDLVLLFVKIHPKGTAMAERTAIQVVGWLGNIGYTVVVDEAGQSAAEAARQVQAAAAEDSQPLEMRVPSVEPER